MRLLVLLVVVLAGCVRVAVPGLSGPLVGLQRLTVKDPLSEKVLDAIVFYPSATPLEGAATRFGPWPLEGRLDVPISRERHPFVVLIHGHQGSRFGHHDLGEALARAGYVVAAVDHAGDSWNDQSTFGTDRGVYGRAYQASALIDAVLADPRLGPWVDPERIGAAGFSAGGLTALILVGAVPDFSRVRFYCERHPEDRDFCSSAPRLTPGTPRPALDERVRAAFTMAPVGVLLSEASLEGVRQPVYVAEAERDTVLLPEENAAVVLRGLRLDSARVVPDAGHFVFLAPCPAALRDEMRVQCVDPPGVDRVAVHAMLATDALAFFERSFGPGGPPPPPPLEGPPARQVPEGRFR